MAGDERNPGAASSAGGAVVPDSLADFFVDDSERQSTLDQSRRMGGEAHGGGPVAALDLMTFQVADERYCVGIEEIQEIIKVPEITDVPRAPAGVIGILSLRGTIVPLLDLRRVLHLEARPVGRSTRVIVLKGWGDPIGLMVDRVTSVVRIDAERMEAPPVTMSVELSELLVGIGRVGEEIIIVIDVAALLRLMGGGP